MSNREYQVPDLASVLKTLAALAPSGQRSHTPQPEAFSNPSEASRVPTPLLRPVSAPTPKLIDPATIIDWSSGLRCIMKTVAAQETIIGEIRRMIKVQHEHEEQWWSGRQALLRRQEARIEGQKKLNDVLRSVGGIVTEHIEDNDGELRTFDMKVYRAQVQMVKEMSTKLRGFGVPFFGTRNDLVQRSSETVTDGKITEAELVDLQRRMIVMLEDLCKE